MNSEGFLKRGLPATAVATPAIMRILDILHAIWSWRRERR